MIIITPPHPLQVRPDGTVDPQPFLDRLTPALNDTRPDLLDRLVSGAESCSPQSVSSAPSPLCFRKNSCLIHSHRLSTFLHSSLIPLSVFTFCVPISALRVISVSIFSFQIEEWEACIFYECFLGDFTTPVPTTVVPEE